MEFNPAKQKTKTLKREVPDDFGFDPTKPRPKAEIQKIAPVAKGNRPLEPEQNFIEFETEVELGKVKAWSFSSIKRFEQCPAAIKYGKVDKIQEPSNPAMERGNAIHKEAENYIQGFIDELPKSLAKFPDYYQYMRDEFTAGRAIVEEDWAHRIDWSECGWKDGDAWYRGKLDVFILENETSAVIIDHKGLPINTPLPTPTGWTTMGEVEVGDTLYDMDGDQTTVLEKSKIKNIGVYEITFDDSSTIRCDEEHLWTLTDGRVLPITNLRKGHYIPVAKAIVTPEAVLPIDPYILGYWLGNGKRSSSEITIGYDDADDMRQIIEDKGLKVGITEPNRIKAWTVTVLGLRKKFVKLGVLRNKHIPDIYLRASIEQRIELMRGLMDSDGSVNSARRRMIFCNTNKRLSDNFFELAASLGLRPTKHPQHAFGFGIHTTAHNISFRANGFVPFHLKRKAEKVLLEEWGIGRGGVRRVKSIREIESEPTQCISVSSPTKTFLCGEQFCVTHNSGRKYGNETKHQEQGLLYAITAFIRYPALEVIKYVFVYVDHGVKLERTLTRAQALRFHALWHRRGLIMTTATMFDYIPSAHNCRWCYYGKEGICPNAWNDAE